MQETTHSLSKWKTNQDCIWKGAQFLLNEAVYPIRFRSDGYIEFQADIYTPSDQETFHGAATSTLLIIYKDGKSGLWGEGHYQKFNIIDNYTKTHFLELVRKTQWAALDIRWAALSIGEDFPDVSWAAINTLRSIERQHPSSTFTELKNKVLFIDNNLGTFRSLSTDQRAHFLLDQCGLSL